MVVHKTLCLKGYGLRTLLSVSVVVLLVCLGLVYTSKRGDTMNDDKVSHTIKCSDIPQTVKLIGRLGVPLGEETVTIRGKWEACQDSKETDDLKFVVTKLNGKAVQIPIEIPSSSVEPLASYVHLGEDSYGVQKWEVNWYGGAGEHHLQACDGDEWEMIGFELGRTTGWPQDILQKYSYVQQPYNPGTFVTTFYFVTVRMFGKPNEECETAVIFGE